MLHNKILTFINYLGMYGETTGKQKQSDKRC